MDANTAEADWTIIDPSYGFKFSLFSNSLIEVTKPDGEMIFGYFKALDRATGAINIAHHQNPLDVKGRRPGTRTLLSFRKFNIDRLGRISEIKQETRTWHGVACI